MLIVFVKVCIENGAFPWGSGEGQKWEGLGVRRSGVGRAGSRKGRSYPLLCCKKVQVMKYAQLY